MCHLPVCGVYYIMGASDPMDCSANVPNPIPMYYRHLNTSPFEIRCCCSVFYQLWRSIIYMVYTCHFLVSGANPLPMYFRTLNRSLFESLNYVYRLNHHLTLNHWQLFTYWSPRSIFRSNPRISGQVTLSSQSKRAIS